MNFQTNTLFFILILVPLQVYSQVSPTKLQLDLDLQVLSISHQENYFYRDWGLRGPADRFLTKLSSRSTSFGFCTSLAYRVLPPIRISLGLGYDRITIHGLSGLNQGRLPADRRSDTYELVLSPKTTYHIARIPLKVIIDPFPDKRIHPTLNVGLAGQYYFHAHYLAGKYSGPVPKNDFAGWSSFAGLEVLVKLSDRWSVKVGYDYTLTNPEYVDDILFNQGSKDAGVGTYGIPLTFNYQVFKVGLSRAL